MPSARKRSTTRSKRISVVVLAKNEAGNLEKTVENLRDTLPPRSEIVVVDDGSTDGGADFLARSRARNVRLLRTDKYGIARGRNHGAQNSTGDIVVFSDAHCEADRGWHKHLLEILENPKVGAVGPVIADMFETERKGYGLKMHGPDPKEKWILDEPEEPAPVPLLPGCFIAMRREVFEHTGGFDSGMIRWGQNDNEISLRLWLLGYELWMTPDTEVRHLFRGKHPYEVDWAGVIHNKLRLAHVHFNRKRIARVEEELQKNSEFGAGKKLLKERNAAGRRKTVDALRKRDAEWYFDRFGPRW